LGLRIRPTLRRPMRVVSPVPAGRSLPADDTRGAESTGRPQGAPL